MKTKLINVVTAACLLLLPSFSFGQTVRPTMGTTENFVLFTSAGALSSTGASQLTHITGDVSSDTAPLTTNLGNIDGTIYISTDGAAVQCAADLVDLYDELFGLTQDDDLPAILGSEPIYSGVYGNNVATTLDGNLVLDANGDPDALFIFIIKAPGTFTTAANSSMELINGAQACNVFWLVGGAVSFGAGSIAKGTFVSEAAISFGPESELEGRALTKAGAIAINNGVIGFLAQKPIGCGSPVLTGPAAPDLASAGCFALFTGDGTMTNSGTSTIVGDVGSNTASPTGFDEPTTVDGTVHANPNDETEQAALDLSDAFDFLVALPHDIVLLAPAVFGYNLILTPHTYLLSEATLLTGNLYLDAQGNPDAVFIIKVDAAFTTAVDSKVLLINGAIAENVYWKVTGAVSIETESIFEGTIIVDGAVELKSAVELNGRALTKTGNFSTVAITATSPGCGTAPEITTQPIDQEVCDGGSASFTVEAIGTDLTYQWRKGTVDLEDLTENISGATTATLTIDPVSLSDAAEDYNVVVTGSVDPYTATSNNVSLTINSAPEITEQPANQVGCVGGSVSFTVEATGADLTYQWRKGTVDLDDLTENISGATTATLTIDPVSIDDAVENYNVVISGACAPDVISDNASLVIDPAPEITEQPANQIGCEGASVSFSVAATGADLTYQWRIGEVDLTNTGNISGTTTATLTIDPVALFNAATDYNVVITGACEPAVTSSNASLEIGSAPEITEQPANQIGCESASVSFSVTATGTELTYQWRKGADDLVDGDAISGATTATLTIDPVSLLDSATDYNVVIIGACEPAVTSSNASLEINFAPEITEQPADQIGCEGASVSFSVTASGTDLAYQWRIGEVDLTNTGNISGATTAALTINPVALYDVATDYNVVITGACEPAVTSSNASLEINSTIEITEQPADQFGCEGSSASFSVTATGADLTYQWRKGTDDLVDGDSTSGATTAKLTIDPVTLLDAATDYNVVITSACAPAVTSSNASLEINSAPEITLQPADQEDCEGGSVSFTVVATGTDLTYQWRKGTVDLDDLTENISGATTATLTIFPVDASDAAPNYNVVVTGTCDPDVTSNNASLVVNFLPEIIAQPENQTECVGGSASFSVTVTGTNISYQWRKGTTALVNSTIISGATTATLTIDPVAHTDAASNYNVLISSTCLPDFASDDASLTFYAAPEITEQPIDQTANVGGIANFSVTAIGTDITYQWRKGTVELANTGNILGATSSTLIIDPVSESDAAEDYNVVVSGACDPAVTSIDASLTVTPTGISDVDSENQIALYPNPFTALVNIRLNDVLYGKKYELLIYNASGVLVVKKTITEQTTVIDTSQFASGIYFYHVIGNDKAIQSGKLIKQQ